MTYTQKRYIYIILGVISTILPEILIQTIPGPLPFPPIVIHLAGAVVTILIAYLLIRNITDIFQSLKEHLATITDGTREITACPDDGSSRRVNSMTSSVNALLEYFHHSFVSIKNLWRKDYEIGLDIQSNANTIFDSARNIEASADSLQGVTTGLDKMVSDSMGLIDGIQTSLTGANQLYYDQSSAVEESSASVEELISSIQNIAGISEAKRKALSDLLTVVQKGKDDIDKTMNAFASIGEATKFMQELVEMIEEVAERTNLLSMNAAIEAAHAGESGKGFAVVAEEIKHLAESSRNSTSSISSSLKGINSNIDETIEGSSALKTSIDAILMNVRETAGSMEEILNGMSEMSAGTIQISEALTNLKTTSNETKRHRDGVIEKTGRLHENLMKVDKQSKANSNDVNKITGDVHTISDSLGVLFNLSDNNSQNLVHMRSRLDQFKNRKRFICDYLPPFQYVGDNIITGVFTEAVELMLSHIGESEHIEFMSWQEAQDLAMDTPDVFLMTVIRSAQREKQFRWIGPIVPDTSHLYRLAGRDDIVINNAADLGKYRAGCVSGTWGYNYFIKGGMDEKNITTYETHSMCIQNLLLGNVDVIPIAELQLNHQLKEMNRSIDQVVPAYSITEFSTDLYMVTSLKTSDAVYNRYAAAFEAVKNTGKYKKILAKYRK